MREEVRAAKMRLKKGQSILEYTLLFGMVVAVIVFVLFSGGQQSLENKLKHAYDKAGDAVVDASDRLNEVFY